MNGNDLTTYWRIRDQLKVGDCFGYHSNTWLGRIIRLFSPVLNHVGLSLPFPEYQGKAARIWTLEALEHGIVLAVLSDRLEQYDGNVWWYPLKDEYQDKRKDVGEYMLAQAGRDYDYRSLFKNILGYVSADARKLFCSEYVFMAYKYAGIIEGEIAPRPGDIPKWPIFKDAIKLF